MKRKLLTKSLLLLCAFIVGSMSAWAQTVTLTSAQIKAGEGSTSYGDCSATDGGGNTWNAYAIKNQHSNATSDYHFWQIKKYASNTAYYVQVPTLGTKITQLKITVSSTSKPRTGGGNAATLFFSSSNSTSATGTGVVSGTGDSEVTIDASSLNLNTGYITASGALRIWDIEVTYEASSYTITAQSNNTSYGTVSLSGSTITANPATGYRVSTTTPYTVSPANSATVSQNGNTFTVIPTANTTVTINFEAIPTYTVTFNAEGGSCATSSLTESVGGQGVILPTATTSVAGWSFAGWAATATTNTQTAPTLYAAGETYHPTVNATLHAVYKLVQLDGYKRATSITDITGTNSVVIVCNSANKVLDTTLGTVAAPSEANNKIDAPAAAIFTLTGDNTDGYTLTNGLMTIGAASTANSTVITNTTTNDLWVVKSHNTSNTFYFENKEESNLCLEYYNGSWMVYAPSAPKSNAAVCMKVYVPNEVTAYNSTPTEIINPTVTFAQGGTTLYLDGTTSYTNAASVTGVSKTINYSSSNTSVATVSAEGVVTAVGIGTATITASVDAELGVSNSASATYDVTVKSATTLAGIKALAKTSTAVNFAADLASDLVITYVNGNHAYLQSGDVAVYATCATADWTAGKKFTGAITGKVKLSNSEPQITEIDQEPVVGGTVPEAIVLSIADINAYYPNYEGRKVVVNGATINTAMSNTDTSGGRITTDGTNTLNIYAPLEGVSLVKNEKGNVTGFVSRYNTSLRLCLYEQSMFEKTHNVPQNQEMAFDNSDYNLDEETDAVTNFAGQDVTATNVKGTLTYSIQTGSDDIISSLNPSTGAVSLNGSCGTATIVATAAYAEEVGEGGYLTPYNELAKEYSITVRPRYTVTFSVNGVTETRRQDSFGAAITTPDVAAVGDYVFVGWSDTEVTATDVAPTMTTGSSITPESTKTVYAVFATRTQTGTTDVLDQSYSYKDGHITVGGSYSDMSTSNPPYYLLHNGGYVESEEFDLSTISKVVVYGGYYGGSDYRSITIGDGTNIWKSVSVNNNNNQAGTNTYTGGTALSGTGRLRITSTCVASSSNGVRVSGFEIYKLGPVYDYAGYTSSLATISINSACTDGTSYFGTYYTDVAYRMPAGVVGQTVTVANDVLTVTDAYTAGTIVPANTALLLKAETAGEKIVSLATGGTAPASNSNMLKGTLTADEMTVGENCLFYRLTMHNGTQIGFWYGADGGAAFAPGANKAYLAVPKTQGNARMGFTFGGDATGIEAVSSKTAGNNQYYDLQGRRVMAPAKGLYIVNGKKVYIK